MRVLICGGRDWNDPAPIELIVLAYKFLFPSVTVIEGEARGADSMAREAAETFGARIKKYPADWDGLGKKAGPIRNSEMLKEEPDVVWAFHDQIENSKGTRDMCDKAHKAGLPVYVVSRYKPERWKAEPDKVLEETNKPKVPMASKIKKPPPSRQSDLRGQDPREMPPEFLRDYFEKLKLDEERKKMRGGWLKKDLEGLEKRCPRHWGPCDCRDFKKFLEGINY